MAALLASPPARTAQAVLRTVLPLLVGLSLCAGAAAGKGGLRPCADEGVIQAQWLAALNAVRAQGAHCSAGDPAIAQAPELHWAPELADGARYLAEDLAAHDRVAHTDSADRDFEERVRATGYPFRAAGENVAAGQADFNRTLRAWLASPSHCRTMMRSRYTEVGLACFERSGSSYGRYWVAHFGQPQDDVRRGSPLQEDTVHP